MRVVQQARAVPADGTIRLLLVGHWTPRKGILEALAALRQVSVSVVLELVGEQDRDLQYAAQVREALRDPLLAGRVRVHGRLPDDALAALYHEVDALLLPSSHEGYGMVLAEALAAGLPIIATRVGAIPEVVRDGLEAELVTPGDAAALAQAIRRLAGNPADRASRSKLAQERAWSLPAWAESIAAFARLLDGLGAGVMAGAGAGGVSGVDAGGASVARSGVAAGAEIGDASGGASRVGAG